MLRVRAPDVHGLVTKLTLRVVVVDWQSPILEEAVESYPLIARVAHAIMHGRVFHERRPFGVAPGEEALNNRL